MLSRMLASRGLMSATVVLVLVAAGAIGLTLSHPRPHMRTYCADMPDSIGLFKDSAVTIMGVPVGRVTKIAPVNGSARVEFTIPADRKLPPDVGAVTVSDTLIADRQLALIGNEPSGDGWDASKCITKTLTPKSLSQTFDALTKIADQLDGTADPAQRGSVGAGLDSLDRLTSGTGDQLRGTIDQLSKALASPNAAIGHLGKILDDLTDLAHKARGNWPDVKTSVTGITETFTDINNMAFPPITELVDSLAEVLPQLNDAIVMFGSPSLRAIDSIPNLPQLLSVGVGSLAEIIRLAPVIASGFSSAVDKASGRTTIGYAPPHGEPVSIPALLGSVSGR